MALKTVLLIIASQLTPGTAIGPLREILAIIIGIFLPRWIVNPVNQFTYIVFPPIIKFEEKMKKYPRLSQILPGFIAAEILLIVTGMVLVVVAGKL